MAKRFTDTKKWDKRWYMGLPPKTKLLWQYLCDCCDGCAIWDVNTELASFKIGEIITEDDIRLLGDRVVFLSGDKLWIPSWVLFHYKKLKQTNKVHVSVAKRILSLIGGLSFDGETADLVSTLNQLLINPLPTPDQPLIDPLPGVIGKRIKDKGERKEDKDLREEAPPPISIAPPVDNFPPAKKPSLEGHEAAVAQFQKTLDHFKAGREPAQTEIEELWKMIKGGILVSELVHAISGMRFEPGGLNYDPGKHINIFRLWDREKRLKLYTLGTQEAAKRQRNSAGNSNRPGASGALSPSHVGQPTPIELSPEEKKMRAQEAKLKIARSGAPPPDPTETIRDVGSLFKTAFGGAAK